LRPVRIAHAALGLVERQVQLSLPIVHWQIPVRESQSARPRTGVLPMKFTSEKPHCSCAVSAALQPQIRVPSVEIEQDPSRFGLLQVLHAMRRPLLNCCVQGHVAPATSARTTSGNDGAASVAGTRSSVTAPQPASHTHDATAAIDHPLALEFTGRSCPSTPKAREPSPHRMRQHYALVANLVVTARAAICSDFVR
jgi:hypothetical protein